MFLSLTLFLILYFVFFTPTVYCEEVNDLFPVVQQFSDLSSLDTKTLIRAAYSGVSGIYMFQCTETGGMYIGSSINLYDRFYEHLSAHSSNLHLQNAANKYTWDSFIFRIIETCPSSELIAREQSYLDIIFNNFPKELVYNFCAVAYSMLGYIHTPETKAAISAAMSVKSIGNTNRLGTTNTAESKAKVSKNIIGNTNGWNQPSSKSIYVYDPDSRKLVGEFPSQVQASKSLQIPYTTLLRYLANGKVWNNK
jgi:group I intron endonuclease